MPLTVPPGRPPDIQHIPPTCMLRCRLDPKSHGSLSLNGSKSPTILAADFDKRHLVAALPVEVWFYASIAQRTLQASLSLPVST